MPDIDPEETWQLVLPHLTSPQRHQALDAHAVPLSLADLGHQQMVEGRPGKAESLLKPVFEGARQTLDERSDPTVHTLCEAYNQWNHLRKKREVRLTRKASSAIRATGWQRMATIRMAVGEAPGAGLPALSRAGKATIWRILHHSGIQPHRLRYYLDKRDPDFESKMREVLMVYQGLAWQREAAPSSLITVSLDEKPGVQAIANTTPDLAPQPGHHATWGRDDEYVRHGTLSILAALDLHDGHIIAQVHERHRSREYIELLKALDAHYPPECTIRIVLDNHSSHISKETMAYLATRANRFVYVHTPKHGSWLNLIEMAFSKMARPFLHHIRVGSKEELKRRILQGVDEMNAAPVVMRWKQHDLELTH